MQHFERKTFAEAVDFLLAWNGCCHDPPIRRTRPPPSQKRPAFVLPPSNSDNKCVSAYLRGRGISSGIIDSFIDMGLLYDDSEHHNCVFVGYNSAGKAAFAAKRGTCGTFKGDVAGSDKRIAFRLPCSPELVDVHVFESPIDLMSWFTLHERSVANAIALCGLHDGPLETYLNENPHIRRIALCLDADGPGREAADRLTEKYHALGYETAIRFPTYGKDWNEHLRPKG